MKMHALTKETLTFEPIIMIKPSPPSSSMALLELSNLDHMLNFYSSAILFYSPSTHFTKSFSQEENLCSGKINGGAHPHGHATDVVAVLKSALQTLLGYYPAAAGRMRVNHLQKRLEVECNDQGLQFVVAHANIMLSHLGDVSLAHPSLDLLFPVINFDQEKDRPPIVAMQVTKFNCGGFALSINNNHAYLDGHSAAVFLHNLASIARGDGLSIVPDTMSRRERMKPQYPPKPTFQHPLILKKGDETFNNLNLLLPERYANVTRLLFCPSALERLRCAALFGHKLFNACSRYEALIALLWKARAKSLIQFQASPSDIELPIKFPKNLREKTMPTLSQGYVGSGICPIPVTASLKELCESPLHILVQKIQQAISCVTLDYVQSTLDYLECDEGPLGSCLDPSFFGMTSLVGLPFYDTDFGWGYPIYCGVPSRQMNNRLNVLDGGTQARGGWNVMVVLESEKERNLFFKTIENYVTLSI